jgi:acetyl esterase/lipase
MRHEINVEDVEYNRHGGTPLLMRLYRPQGAGPFPIMVELHGGAWCRSDRLADVVIHESLAKSGVIVASLDFRQPPVAPYPASFQDIHYGIRWLKARATELGSRPDMVGSMGNSSGGHQAMLLGMRPFDARYGALPLAGGSADATVRCVIMCSPVIDPIGRYNYAKDLKAKGQPYPALVDEVLPCHDAYWQTEAAMAEGSPARALEQGEKVELPPVLYVQGTEDVAHPRPHLDRFVAAYRKAGGVVDLELFEGEGRGSSCARPAHRPPIAPST